MSKREQNKAERMAHVIENAKKIFDIQGIESTKMTEIADAAEIGVASLYRYFKTKGDIAVDVGIAYWTKVYDFLKAIDTADLSGLDGLKGLMVIYTTESSDIICFFRFIEYLDHYLVKLTERPDKILVYENAVNAIEPLFIHLIEKGIQDGSIKPDLDVRSSYVSVSHSLTALKQKHCVRGLVLSGDTKEQMAKEMRFLIDVFIEYLKNT